VRNPLQEELAARLGVLSGYEDYSLFLDNSGAESNENAAKLASFHTGKDRIIAFRRSFHGRTSGAVALTDNPAIVSPFNAHHRVTFVDLNDGDAVAAGDFISNEPAMWTQHLNPETGKPSCHHIVASHRLKAELRRAGLEPSYGDPTLFRFHRNLFCFMANHEYKLRIDDAQAVSDATVRARKEILALAAGLAKLGGPWKGFRVAATAEQIGHRDARRIHGRYTVTRDDVTAGATFPDAVTTSRFGIDIHGLDRKSNNVRAAGQNHGVKFRPFQIPLRACRARDVDNLYMAGRCISGDFYAHASYRVTGSSVAIGEAVGKAAAAGG
jgi:hypothetical protein